MERADIGICEKNLNFLKEKIFFCCPMSINSFHLYQQPTFKLKVQRAAEPDEIIWENLGYSRKYRLIARLKTIILTFIVLCLCFSLIFGISYLQVNNNFKNKYNFIIQEDIKHKYGKKGDKKVDDALKILSLVASFLIVFINTCLLMQIKKFAEYFYKYN